MRSCLLYYIGEWMEIHMTKRVKLRIGVDARPLVAAKTGIGYYVYNVLEQLAEIDDHNEYFLYSHQPIPGKLPDFFHHVRAANTSKSHFWLQSQLPFWLLKDKINLFWGGGYAAPILGNLIRRWQTVITVHDLVSRRYPETLPWKLKTHMQLGLAAYMRTADRVIADSENTAKDIEFFHGQLRQKVTVVPLAASQRFFVKLSEDAVQGVLTRYGLQKGYLLYVGTIEPRKGVDTILRSLGRLREKGRDFPPIVLVGKNGWKTEGIMALPGDLGLQANVRFLDYVADEDLPALYQGRDFFCIHRFMKGLVCLCWNRWRLEPR